MYRSGEEEIQEVEKVLRSKQWFRIGDPAQGHLQQAVSFERELAQKMGAEHALLMCGGGTAALVCALAGLGIGPGDEVIVPAYTWMATATACLAVGAIPVLAEVNETLTLDPEDFRTKIRSTVKAVIPVHMAGRPADMGKILAIAAQHGIKVIEDACQAVGSSYLGQRTGTLGDAGAYSFNSFKIISSGGEGGALVTNNRLIYDRALIYHDSGTNFRPHASQMSVPIFVAQQYRTDEVSAAIVRVQLQRLDGILFDLRHHCKRIENRLAKGSNLHLAPSNDSEGACGTRLVLQFARADTAAKFSEAAQKAGVAGYLGINNGKHVFTRWEPLLAKRIGHHPDMNPFNFPQNQNLRANYEPDICPRTLDLLRRSYLLEINPDWTPTQAEETADKCCRVAESLHSEIRPQTVMEK